MYMLNKNHKRRILVAKLLLLDTSNQDIITVNVCHIGTVWYIYYLQ